MQQHRRRTTIDIALKGSIVKEKCRQLTEIALELFPDRKINYEDLTFLVSRYIGGDKETIRAYAGYHGSVKRRSSGEGYIIGNTRKGYLEIFDFMHKVGHNEWVIHAQMKLPNADLEFHTNEGLSEKASIEKISISPVLEASLMADVEGNGKPLASTVECGNGCPNIEAKEIENNNNNNNTTERERNFAPKIMLQNISHMPTLTPEELAILNAKPLDSEPDTAKVSWGEEKTTAVKRRV